MACNKLVTSNAEVWCVLFQVTETFIFGENSRGASQMFQIFRKIREWSGNFGLEPSKLGEP